jgi:hypothetical protein
MNWAKFLEVVGGFLPTIGEFVMYLVNLSDDEWEDISKSWPSPTKTKMARLRAEAKATAHFFGKVGE